MHEPRCGSNRQRTFCFHYGHAYVLQLWVQAMSKPTHVDNWHINGGILLAKALAISFGAFPVISLER